MNKRIRTVAFRLVAIGLPLSLLGLMMVWRAGAQDRLPGLDDAQVQYEIDLTGLQAERLEVMLPNNFEYAGLAVGSDVTQRPDVSKNGRHVVWNGPFPETGSLRFWLAPLGPDEAPAFLSVTGANVQAFHVEPVRLPSVNKGVTASADVVSGSIGVTKTVEPTELGLGDNMWITYEVVFTNSASETVALDRITDTLPIGFIFGNPAVGDEVGDPVDTTEPDIVWEGASVPANGTLTMRYNARAVNHSGEYYNSVVAVAGSEMIGPASAKLEVESGWVFIPSTFNNYLPPAPIWEVSKTATPTQVEPGELVSYQVEINNTGNAVGNLSKISDVLPDGFTFVSMVAGSDITTPPSGTTGTISWDGSWALPPGSGLTLIYQVTAGGAGNQVNTVTIYDSSGQPVGTASSTVTVLGGLPYEENFDVSPPADWQPFLNYPGLSVDRWWVAGGVYNYDSLAVLPENTSFDLSIYNAPGAQGWTDYRIETRIKDVKDHNTDRGLTGVWFRGTYQDAGDMGGGVIAGYYFYIKPSDDYLYLIRTDPSVRTLHSQPIVANYYYAPRIGRKHWYDVIIEVRGSNIKVWFGDEDDGIIQVFDWTDPDNAYPNGTVGFAEYYTASRYDYMRVEPLN